MIRLFANPTMLDLLIVSHGAVPDARLQSEALQGVKYDPELTAAQLYAAPGPKWVLKVDDEPVACAGFHPQRPGVWRDWMLTTERAWSSDVWRTLTRKTRRVMDDMLRSGHAHRLECISLVTRDKAHAWYRLLGWNLEGRLHGYAADGQDMFIFSRVKH